MLLREAGVAFPTQCVTQGPYQFTSHGPYHVHDYMLPAPSAAPPASAVPALIDLTVVSDAPEVHVDLTAD